MDKCLEEGTGTRGHQKEQEGSKCRVWITQLLTPPAVAESDVTFVAEESWF